MRTLGIIMGTIVVICGIGLIINGLYELINPTEEITKCYDRYHNEIIGQECIDNNNVGGWYLIFMGILITGFSSILFYMP